MAARDHGPDAVRCIGCETPTRGGRLCAACREERPAPRHIGNKYPHVNGYAPAPADYCQDAQHETPCLLPCPACAVDCVPSQKARP